MKDTAHHGEKIEQQTTKEAHYISSTLFIVLLPQTILNVNKSLNNFLKIWLSELRVNIESHEL